MVQVAARQTTAEGGRVKLLHNKMPAQSKPVVAENPSRTRQRAFCALASAFCVCLCFILSKRPTFPVLEASGVTDGNLGCHTGRRRHHFSDARWLTKSSSCVQLCPHQLEAMLSLQRHSTSSSSKGTHVCIQCCMQMSHVKKVNFTLMPTREHRHHVSTGIRYNMKVHCFEGSII